MSTYNTLQALMGCPHTILCNLIDRVCTHGQATAHMCIASAHMGSASLSSCCVYFFLCSVKQDSLFLMCITYIHLYIHNSCQCSPSTLSSIIVHHPPSVLLVSPATLSSVSVHHSPSVLLVFTIHPQSC